MQRLRELRVGEIGLCRQLAMTLNALIRLQPGAHDNDAALLPGHGVAGVGQQIKPDASSL